jgi:hypothetical protein
MTFAADHELSGALSWDQLGAVVASSHRRTSNWLGRYNLQLEF